MTDISLSFIGVLSLKDRPDSSGWMACVGCLVRFICGNERHFGNAFQGGTLREKMQGILEMPSISG